MLLKQRIVMGACVGSKKDNDKPIGSQKTISLGNISTKYRQSVNDKQLRFLRLLYADSASRSAGGEMTMQNFLLFFHKNGYWGERLFKQFDTGNTNTVTEDEFIRGIVKIFKTSEQKKIELLFKFFSENNINQGISFDNYLKMLYNYPKEEIYKVINDSDFINNELKKSLVSLDQDAMGQRYESILPKDISNAATNKRVFMLNENQNTEKIESKYGATIINEMNKKSNERSTTLNFKVGTNNVEVKTTSVHQLVKRYAQSIFKKYNVDQKTGRLRFQNFRDWVNNHKTLYNDYYKGFHSQVWEVDKETGCPQYVKTQSQFSSKARIFIQGRSNKVLISLLQSILIVCQQGDNTNPICFICLEGLSAGPIFDNQNGYGVQICHRDGVYEKKIFYLLNQELQQEWIQYLKYFKGESANQLYQLKQKIGVGKFSVVYHGIEKQTNQSYAIKVIESYKLDDEARRIISHESSIMSVMSHPLLVFFKETIVTKTHIYIVTELVKGKDLFGLVKDFKYFAESEACYILEQIVVGVRYIHSLGIVHRDLKPENIMVEYNQSNDTIGNIKIIDFGFANYLSSLLKLPTDQLLVGTPNYIAPEILKRQPLNQKIDNFAIGSILYYMLSGNLPFNSIDVTIILQKTVEGSFPMQDRHWRSISPQAKDLVQKLLANDPKQRISLQDVLAHPWLQKNREKRQKKLGMHMQKSNEITLQKTKSEMKQNDAFIF